MEDSLILNENAYFYSKRTLIDATKVNEIFDDILADRTNVSMIYRGVQVSLDGTLASSLIYSFQEPANFTSIRSPELMETKCGYFIMLEYLSYVVVSRRNISNTKKLFSCVSELPYEIIAKLYVDDSSLFERFNLRNMDISEAVVRTRTLEANNLKNSIPLLSSTKYILNSMRLRNQNSRVSLTFSTSRINRVGVKREMNDFVMWSKSVADKVNGFVPVVSYIDIFPRPLSFEDEISGLTPRSILILFSEIITENEEGRIEDIKLVIGTRQITIGLDKFQDYIDQLSKNLSLSPATDYYGKRRFSVSQVNAPSTGAKTLRLSDTFLVLRKKSIHLVAPRFDKVQLKIDGDYVGLASHINRVQNFLVAFDKPDYVYFTRNLFRDTKLLTVIDNFLNIFIAEPGLVGVTSEKGQKAQYNNNMSAFPSNSIFGQISLEKSDADYLACDDLNDEWADFIYVKNDVIELIHAKHGNVAFSGADFHEIVAQAQKNLGHFFSTPQEWQQKTSKLAQKYNNYCASTQIDRLLVGDSANGFLNRIADGNVSPNTRRIVRIYVSFISKSRITAEMRLLNTAPQNAQPQTSQILWLISSLVSSCIESSVSVFIHCAP